MAKRDVPAKSWTRKSPGVRRLRTRPPSQDRLRELLDYNPATGHLTWRVRKHIGADWWNKRYAGKRAGTTTPDGYIVVKIDDRNYGAHRIVWAMVHGYWPDIVDHRNGKPADNRLKNLRNVDQLTNQRNQKRHASNTSGITGVHWVKHRGDWLAYIRVEGRQIHLGFFGKKDAAIAARKAAETKYGFTGRV